MADGRTFDPQRIPTLGWIAAGALLASVFIVSWLAFGPDDEGLEAVMTVDAAGDTLVYSGAVRDAVARARIVEAFNSVAVAEPDSGVEVTTPPLPPDSARRADVARSAREAAVDALARLYTDPVQPEALLEALNLAILDFRPGTTTLPPDALAFLRAAAEVIGRAPDSIAVVVVGHATGEADSEADYLLSDARARAVAGIMVASGLDEERVRAEGVGSRSARDEGRSEGGHIVFSLDRRAPEDAGQPSAASASDDSSDTGPAPLAGSDPSGSDPVEP